jgi:GAF domain-containing protein
MSDSIELFAQSLIAFADTLVSDYDLVDYLDRLLESSTEALGAVAGGVMLANVERRREGLRLLVSTDERARLMELFELQEQEGPCIDSYRLGEAVIEEDLRHTDRWPVFTPVALERGYRSVLALPLRLRGTIIGSLNVFREQTGATAPADLAIAKAFADMATIGIMQERAITDARALASQLQGALQSRIVIEQAKGILAERLQCDVGEAYDRIRWHSRNTNTTMRAAAASVVSGALKAHQLVPRAGAAR